LGPGLSVPLPYRSPYSPPSSLSSALQPYNVIATATKQPHPPSTAPLGFPGAATPSAPVAVARQSDSVEVSTARVDVGPPHLRKGEHSEEVREPYDQVVASKPATMPSDPIRADAALSSDLNDDIGQGGRHFGDPIDPFEGSLAVDLDTNEYDASSESSEEHNPWIDFQGELSDFAYQNLEAVDNSKHNAGSGSRAGYADPTMVANKHPLQSNGADTPDSSELDDDRMFVELERGFNQEEDNFVIFSDPFVPEHSAVTSQQFTDTDLGPIDPCSRSFDEHPLDIELPQHEPDTADCEDGELGLCNPSIPRGGGGKAFLSPPYRKVPYHRIIANYCIVSDAAPNPLPPNPVDLIAGIQALQHCFANACTCGHSPRTGGHTLGNITSLFETFMQPLTTKAPLPHQPLSLPHRLSLYSDIQPFRSWGPILTGVGLDTAHGDDSPPMLNLWQTEADYISKTGPHILDSTFDIDSIIFSPSSLAVFRKDVDWSFLPPFNRSKQQHQRVTFGHIETTKHKCALLCLHDRYVCHIFFPNMPLVYTNEKGREIQSKSQHLDDHALQIWTDQVVLPAFDDVCTPARRPHYPHSWRQLLGKSKVNSEQQSRDNQFGRQDVRALVPASILGPLWDRIILRAATIPNTLLPVDAFCDPELIISNHNLKQSDFSRHDFQTVREKYLQEHHNLWNPAFLSDTAFFVDLGQEIWSTYPGTTLLRKSYCNREWAAQFQDRTGSSKTLDTYYTWAGTEAGSVSTETRTTSSMRSIGIAFNKAYNVNKEQFSSNVKEDTPFENHLFELLSFTEKQIQRLAVGLKNGGLQSSIQLGRILQQWEATKKRIYYGIHSLRNHHMSYSSRQEFRITLHLFTQLPADSFSQSSLDQLSIVNTHRPFWILSTLEVNQFRIFECNRWILCMEYFIRAAEAQQGSGSTIAISHQELYSCMTTALARTLRLSLGCQNPVQQTSLWLGKRWGRRRITTGGGSGRYKTIPLKRQGLNYKVSVKQYGLIWMPNYLGIWSTELPFFRISKYRHLDVALGTLKQSRRGLHLSQETTRDGKFLNYIYRELRIIADENLDFRTLPWAHIFVILSQYCIQAYNIYVWDFIWKRWCQHIRTPENRNDGFHQASREAFQKYAGLSKQARQGTEIICFSKVRQYVGRRLGIRPILTSHASHKIESTFPEWNSQTWGDRIKPLFNPGPEAPKWMNNTPHAKRLLEVEAILENIVGIQLRSEACSRFRNTLWKTARLDIQAILHYTKGNPATLIQASASNSKEKQLQRKSESTLQRTQWMFPKLHKQDQMIAGRIPDDMTLLKKSRTTADMKKVSARLMVFTSSDYNSVSLKDDLRVLHDASKVGNWPSTLLQYQRFVEAFEEELDTTRNENEDESEESDWPPPPSRHRGGETSDEAEFTDD